MRIIKDLYAKYGRSGFAPIGVSLDYNKSEAEKFPVALTSIHPQNPGKSEVFLDSCPALVDEC
jgi:hypothetical protein